MKRCDILSFPLQQLEYFFASHLVAQTQFVRTIVELLSAFARMGLPVKKIAQVNDFLF